MLYKLSLIAWKWHYPVCTAVWRIEIWTNFKYSLYSHKSTQNCNVSLGFPETHPRSGSPREGQNLALQCDLWPGARSPWRQLNNTVTHSEEERKPSCYSWAINYKEITIEKSYERHLHSRILYSRSKYHKSPYTARMVSFWRFAERPNPLSEVAGAWLKWPRKMLPGWLPGDIETLIFSHRLCCCWQYFSFHGAFGRKLWPRESQGTIYSCGLM